MGKANITVMLALMLLANGVMAAKMKENQELMRRESPASTLATNSTGDTKEASAFPQDSGDSKFQINPAGEMMEASAFPQDSGVSEFQSNPAGKTMEVDTRLIAYWDHGNCGPIGDDAHWSWFGCNKHAGDCKERVDVDPSVCTSGGATLVSVQRQVTINGCAYEWYAQYECAEATIQVTQGSCSIDSDGCATSPNYPLAYGIRQACEFKASGIVIESMDFQTESGYDKLTVNAQTYSGDIGPAAVHVTDTMSWTSDYSVQKRGWKICPTVQACSTFISATECPTGRCMWDANGAPSSCLIWWGPPDNICKLWTTVKPANVCLKVVQEVLFGGDAAHEGGFQYGGRSGYLPGVMSDGSSNSWVAHKDRPDFVKFIRCTRPERCPSATACGCESCPSATACGWTLTTAGLLFQMDANDEYYHVAEFWADCAEGGKGEWIAQTSRDDYDYTLTAAFQAALYDNAVTEFYTSEEAGGMIGRLENREADMHAWYLYMALGATRAKIVIKAGDPQKGAKLRLTLRALQVPWTVTECMDAKMCLNAIDLSEEGSQLRNDNGEQLQCLSLPINAGGQACQKWKQCLHQVPKAQGDPWSHMAMLEAILRAAVGSPALVESQPIPDSESSNELKGTCAHPANDDPESWECECGADLQLACKAAPDLARCIEDKMCASNEVCCSWKRDHNCAPADCNDNVLIQATPTLAETLEGRRQPPGSNSSIDHAQLEKSLSSKPCAKSAR